VVLGVWRVLVVAWVRRVVVGVVWSGVGGGGVGCGGCVWELWVWRFGGWGVWVGMLVGCVGGGGAVCVFCGAVVRCEVVRGVVLQHVCCEM